MYLAHAGHAHLESQINPGIDQLTLMIITAAVILAATIAGVVMLNMLDSRKKVLRQKVTSYKDS